jgi:hypothetical protein
MQKTFCSLSFWKKDCAAPKVSAWCAARRAQHAAGNFNNRHVEIVGAAQIRVNVRIFYRPLTAPTGLGLLTTQGPRGGGSSRSSSAWLGRSQKDGLPSLPPSLTDGSRPSTRAGRGSLVAAPLLTTDLFAPAEMEIVNQPSAFRPAVHTRQAHTGAYQSTVGTSSRQSARRGVLSKWIALAGSQL